jgi:uncharacterized protein
MPVRLFESVLSTLSGGPSLTESLGLAPTDLVVVETDGALEQVDSLKSAYDGAAATGFDVFTHTFDEVAAHPGVRVRQLGLAGVSPACRRCPVVRSCGGGLYTHRYAADTAFDNPSVYCADLEALIRGIEQRTSAATQSPAVTDPEALRILQLDLTRLLLAELDARLDGRGGEKWRAVWHLASVVEQQSDGMDEILAHPYTRSWLHNCLDALHAQRHDAVGLALRLDAYVAAAAVRGGLDLPVQVACEGGMLTLPTLGELRLTAAPDRCDVEVRGSRHELWVRVPGREALRVRPGVAGDGWRPVHRPRLEGWPGLVLDDIDPHRDFRQPVSVDEDSESLAEAWTLLRRVDPRQAAEIAASLTTLTPLPSGGLSVGRHGYGALGLNLQGPPAQLAAALLRGFRRAKLQALTEVTDLYAQDGWWHHRAPWQDEPLPVSQLLAGAYERVGLRALDMAEAAPAGPALTTLESSAELTVDGKRLVAALREEAAGG